MNSIFIRRPEFFIACFSALINKQDDIQMLKVLSQKINKEDDIQMLEVLFQKIGL